MGVFHQEQPPNPSKKCKFITATLKDAFSNCNTCRGRISASSLDEEYTMADVDYEQEVIVSEIRSRAMEKLRHKPVIMTDSFSWVFSGTTGELFLTPKAVQQKDGVGDDHDGDDENLEYDDAGEEFLSVGSCLSCCSSAMSKEAFLSAKTNLSRCSSLDGFEFPVLPKRSILQEFCHCQGWPFGLCRKAVLLPPLPRSPSESWSWRKDARIVRCHKI